ncbi:MAG: prepilin-type N-terminal cleavage/methylation domain-containing protein [Pseudomonadota bacterium]
MRRQGDAGVTLVEVLTVLAIIGTLAGALTLAVAPPERQSTTDRAAQLLATRLIKAADHALIDPRPFALAWSDRSYVLMIATPEGWASHPAAPEGETPVPQTLSAGEATSPYIVSAHLVPEATAPLRLTFGGGPHAVLFDGLFAEALP